MQGARRLTYRLNAVEEGASASVWITLPRGPATIDTLAASDPYCAALVSCPEFGPWTDERWTILPLLTFGR